MTIKLDDNCEHDCKHQCMGCYRIFHDIKTEDNLPHDKELPEAVCTVEGNHYCHFDCFRDSNS